MIIYDVEKNIAKTVRDDEPFYGLIGFMSYERFIKLMKNAKEISSNEKIHSIAFNDQGIEIKFKLT